MLRRVGWLHEEVPYLLQANFGTVQRIPQRRIRWTGQSQQVTVPRIPCMSKLLIVLCSHKVILLHYRAVNPSVSRFESRRMRPGTLFCIFMHLSKHLKTCVSGFRLANKGDLLCLLPWRLGARTIAVLFLQVRKQQGVLLIVQFSISSWNNIKA